MPKSFQETLTLKGHADGVNCVAFSPDGQRLASASTDKTVKVWHAYTGQETLTFKGYTGSVTSLAFSPDGQRLASASDDNTVKISDAVTGQEILALTGHTAPVKSVVFSRDGQRLASASGDKTVKVRDAATGREILTLKGHTREVFSVAFSPDGQRLASASVDKTVKVWDARTGQETLTLKGHAVPVYSVVFRPDGEWLASAGGAGTVKVWDATPLTSASTVERQALSFFRFVAETLVLKDEMLERIRRDQTISEPVRQQALAWMEDYREFPYQLNAASWSVARRANEKPAAYRLALRQAEAACRLEPNDGNILNTLGVAQYRSGQYPEALKTLMQADKIYSAKSGSSQPADLAFLAMTHHQLGHKAQPAATLARLREVMKKAEWATNEDAKDGLQEAETLIEGKPAKPKP